MRNLKQKIKTIFSVVSISVLVMLGIGSCDDTDYTYVPEPIQPHVISDYSPTIGDIGYEVTITGENFSPTLSNNKVRFNGELAIVKGGDTSTLIVEVPEGATTGDLTVSHQDLTVNAGVFTVVSVPVIETFTPKYGQAGEEVIISGAKFSSTLENNNVFFNGMQATVTSATETELTVIIPEGTTTGPLAVEVEGQSAESEEDFIIALSLRIPLTAEEDDVEEVAVDFGEPVGTMDLASSDLEIGEISSGQGLMNIGLRFNDVTLPEGAQIIEAYVQFNTDDDGADEVEMTIYGENVANAAPYTETLGDLSARTLTNANEVWNIAPWVTPGDRGEAQKTVNISSIIQEIIDRDDWTSGNSINVIMKNTGVSAGATLSSGGREAENYSSSNPEEGAELIIVY